MDMVFLKDGRRMSSLSSPTENAMLQGEWMAINHCFRFDDIAKMLKCGDLEDIYKAFWAIKHIKPKKIIPVLINIALYDEDLAIQEQAIESISVIGGIEANEALTLLNKPKHRCCSLTKL